MITNPFKKQAFPSNLIYITKCLAGVIVCYIPYVLFPQYPFYWAIVSVVIVLSPDHSTTQAYNRIKANILGCAVGICLYPLQLPNLLILCIGVILTICIGLALNIKDAVRSALAGFVIVTIQQERSKHWFVAVERVMCVVSGCVIALLITILFNLILSNRNTRATQH
jgi:uncharacterized membrane protein YgaE (UPF0421/DUF939 family)